MDITSVVTEMPDQIDLNALRLTSQDVLERAKGSGKSRADVKSWKQSDEGKEAVRPWLAVAAFALNEVRDILANDPEGTDLRRMFDDAYWAGRVQTCCKAAQEWYASKEDQRQSQIETLRARIAALEAAESAAKAG